MTQMPHDDQGPQDEGDDLVRRDASYTPEDVEPEPDQYDVVEVDDEDDGADDDEDTEDGEDA